LAVQKVEENIAGLTAGLNTFFHRAAAYAASRDTSISMALKEPEIISNITWHKDMTMLHFLQVVGVNVRVPAMLNRER
jgi:tyrosyl-tRNA synthetase